jgi:glycosyltransferase involved in cell wall biosynthesis
VTRQSRERKRVLHIATRFLHGGSERDLVEAIHALPGQDYESCLLVGPEHNRELIGQMLPGTRVEVEPNLLREVSPSQDIRAASSITRFIRRNRFDVVHTCQSKAGIVGRLAASVAGTPLILHSLSMANIEHQRASMSMVYVGAERVAARWTDAYFVVGTDLMQRYLRAGIADPARFQVVRSSIDLTRFEEAAYLDRRDARERLGLPCGREVVAYVGSLEERKGVLRLPAYLRALRTFTEGSAHLVIAGVGPLEGELRADFARQGLSDSVTFLGFTKEVPTVMAAADCLVLLSDAEGLPQVLVQAAAVRRPFVAFPIDGAAELIWHGATGSVLKHRDPVEAARATLQYLGPCEVRPVDLRDWSSAAVRQGYRQVFDAQTARLADTSGHSLLRRRKGVTA